MNDTLRDHVRGRAKDRCEYCRLPQSGTVLPHEVDHIRSQKHGGQTAIENLCWACAFCNSFKGSDVAGFPPGSDEITRLFNPRSDDWPTHFYWDAAVLQGKTPLGAATIALLRINLPARVVHRQLLMLLREW